MLFISTDDPSRDVNDLMFKGQLIDYTRIDTPLCELSLLKYLLDTNPDIEHFGLVSSGFQAKTHILPSEFEAKAKIAIAEGYDVIVLNPYRLTSAIYPNSYYQGEASGHRGIGELAIRTGLLSDIVEHQPMETLLFCNFVYGTRSFFTNFLSQVEAVLKQLKSNDELWSIANSPAGYRWKLDLPMFVFFLERILGYYLSHNKDKFKICYADSAEWRKRKYSSYSDLVEGLMELRKSFDNSGLETDREKLDFLRAKILSNPILCPIALLEEPHRYPSNCWKMLLEKAFSARG